MTKKESFSFSGFTKLPSTMDWSEWGKYKYISDNYVLVFKPKSTLEYHIQMFDNYHTVELRHMKIKNKNNNILVSFTEKMNDKDNLGTFTRTIKNQEYIYIDSDLKIKKIIRKTSFLKNIKPSIFRSDKFIIMDLETRYINNINSPYCISI